MGYQYALINVAPEDTVIEAHRQWLYSAPFSVYFDSKEEALKRKLEIEAMRLNTEEVRKVNPSAVFIAEGTTVGLVRRKTFFGEWENEEA